MSRVYRAADVSCEEAAGVRKLPAAAAPQKGVNIGVRRSRTSRNAVETAISARGSTPAAFRHSITCEVIEVLPPGDTMKT